MPVLNDWISAHEVIKRLDSSFASRADSLSILLADDGSTEPIPAYFGQGPYTRVEEVGVLILKKNIGHQRALAVGLCHIAEKIACDAIVVMDSDGEDDPGDAARLVEKLSGLYRPEISGYPIIFAERTRRSETFTFKLGYLGYRIVHHALTGRGIRFGNFSVIPRERLGALTVEPMLWNHYAASVAGSRLPHTTMPTHRASRIAGKSHLSYVNLVIHGLSALSCYSEIIGVRLILMVSFLLGLTFLAVLITVTLWFVTHLSISAWTALFASIFMVFLFQGISLVGVFTMQIISGRSEQPFLPIRDYTWYVNRIHRVYGRPAP